LRVVTLNVNGIRSAAKKGLYRWLAAQKADVICLQEVKAQAADLEGGSFAIRGFERHISHAEKKGYSGVALYSRHKTDAVVKGFGAREFDAEGRYLEARFGKLSVVSVYLPSGSSGPHRQASKFRFLDAFLPQLEKLKRSGREVILCGDWNIAHREIDLRNWRANRKNSGFLPEERDWLSRVFEEVGFVDVFRRETGAIHLVVEPRPGLGEKRRLADRLPDRHAGDRRRGQARIDLQAAALLRPRPPDHRLRRRARLTWPAAWRRAGRAGGRATRRAPAGRRSRPASALPRDRARASRCA